MASVITNDSFKRIINYALKDVAEVLEIEGIPFCLIGSLSAWFAGAERQTAHDADFAIKPEDVLRAAKAFEQAGFRVVLVPEEWLFKIYVDPQDGLGEILVDLIYYPSGQLITDEVLERATYRSVFSVPMRCLHPQDLFVQKLMALREKSCDYSVLISLYRSLREQIDWDKLKKDTESNPYTRGFFTVCEAIGIVHEGAPINVVQDFEADRKYFISQERRQLIEHLKHQAPAAPTPVTAPPKIL